MKTRNLIILALAVGCGDKSDSSTGAAEETTKTNSEFVPDDKASQEFGKRLMKADLASFKPVEGDDVKLVYSSFTFDPDGSWQANGAVEIMDETMECLEAGTWTMDAADSESTASMTWNRVKTNCAGRDPGEQRVKLTLKKDGSYEVELR